MLETLRKEIIEFLKEKLKTDSITVEEPKKGTADLAIPLFSLVKELGKPINEVYDLLSGLIKDNFNLVLKLVFLSGFLNIFIKRDEFAGKVLKEIYDLNENYGKKEDNKKCVVIDYSSPNIAKSFSVGHLRSTMIGNSIKNIYKMEGYRVTGINHLGDWGTQFGKTIVAYKKWGDDKLIEKDPIAELQKLYVKFHDEATPELESEARAVFRDLENNNKEYLKLWSWIKEVTLEDLDKIYKRLNVSFDSYEGEAHFNDKMDKVIEELDKKGLLKVDDGATIVELEGMPPALIKKSDGTSLYITRDLAALIYRYEKYHFDKIIYVVGNEQKLHFEQLKALSKKIGYDFDIEHVNFGLVLYEGKKMSTREGKNAKLSAVMDEAVKLAYEAINEKNPDLKDKRVVAEAVGVGAIVFNDLKNERHLDYDFNIENMLKFEGNTGPYLQYSGVRINSLLKNEKINLNNLNKDKLNEDHYFELVKVLSQFPHIIEKAMNFNNPSVIARYLLNLSQGFNHFYGKERILSADESMKNTNLLLVSDVRTVIIEGLKLLGIKPLKEM